MVNDTDVKQGKVSSGYAGNGESSPGLEKEHSSPYQGFELGGGTSGT